ncbi:MAG: DUF5082 domain-containing protein [Clostridiales Family XIII bacterium]|jgi:hypothetical protein|nr:DUF5082 domain-containing protein [Clostridiales Family XIII bacterium]
MADEASLRSQVSSQEAQKSNCEWEKGVIEEKIRRLREAERLVRADKAVIKDLRNEVQRKRDPGQDWEGNQRNRYHDFVDGDFRQDYNAYLAGVDALHDDMIRKITSLENEANDLTGLIGFLSRSINSLWGEISALFN